MLNWVIIGILIVLILFFLKVKHIKQRFFWIVLILLALFFYVTASQIFSDNKIDLKSFDGIAHAGKVYFNWLVHLGGNIKTISGEAVKLDWAGNSSASSNIEK